MANLEQTGRTAVAAGVLMLVGTEGEWLLDPQTDDGTVTNLPVFALLALVATVGFGLLLAALLGLRGHATPTRPARVGARLSVVGAGLLVVFGVTALVTAVVSGSPWEGSFVAFLLGLLLLAVGPITWGLSLRRHVAGVWVTLLVSGVAAFVALAAEADPWHDVALSTSFLAWTGLGLLLLRRGPRATADGVSGVRRSARASRTPS